MIKKPKILWVIHGDDVYGVKRAILSLMTGVQRAGWEVCAVSLGAGECLEAVQSAGFEASNIHAAEAPGLYKARSKLRRVLECGRLFNYQLQVGRRLRAEFEKSLPDAVHSLATSVLPAIGWAAAKTRIPCFWEMSNIVSQNYPLDLNRRLYRLLIKRYGIRALANSRYTANTLGKTTPPAEVMYLGADPDLFDGTATQPVQRESLGIPENAVVFVIVARIDQSKGQALFLRALLALKNPRLHLVLVGGDTGNGELQRVQTLAREQGCEDHLHIVGHTQTPQHYMAMADIVVNARLDPEPFGLSTVEGMMMGKPLLVHALGGPAETVVDGKTGWHVKQPTEEGFRSAIERCLSNRTAWPEFGTAGRARALEYFSLPAQAKWFQNFASKHIAPSEPR